MKLPFKILLINVGIAVLLSLLYSRGDGFFLIFGLTGLFGGAVDLIVGLFLLLIEDKRYAQGFLLSGGVLMLLGFVACSTLR